MKIGIIGAMEEEIRLLKAELREAKIENYLGLDHICGRLGSYDVVLVQSGIGKVNASISVMILKLVFQVDLVINTGSAGALDPGLKIGDMVLANALTYHDVDLTGFGYQYGQMAGMPPAYYPDTEWLRRAQDACRALGIEPVLGLIVSGDQFISDRALNDKILENFPRARACEMESAAIAQTAYALDLAYLIIRAISDQADGKASIDFDDFIVQAGQQAASIVLQLLEHGPEDSKSI